ncbi:glycosyltransferase family 2 protein [Slackia piriformis]|uniref:glycosyltransferase family 2 protein n=1 Tax=Slackia piriformis TaxID=626934 RepID=UPI002804070A|nr:glycosyltransferase [uncultured Slackia sp.]
MKFSVLVPVYNVESFLPECLASIESQTYRDFEVILVNDGSTDSSGALCRSFAEKHSDRVKLVEQRNRGLLLARRAAIKEASGEYLVSLDSDDALRADALEVVASKLRETDADVVAFQSSRHPSFEEPYFSWDRLLRRADEKGRIPLEAVQTTLLTSHDFNTMWGKAIRTSCVDRDVCYDAFEGLQYGEDLLQVAPVLDRAKTIVLVSDVLYFYRVNQASISHDVKRSRLTDIETVRSLLASYAESWNPGLLPKVFANDAIEVLAYCLMCANRMNAEASLSEIRAACDTPFFKRAISGADFEGQPSWKRIALLFLEKGWYSLFRAYCRLLFGALGMIGSSKVDRYC